MEQVFKFTRPYKDYLNRPGGDSPGIIYEHLGIDLMRWIGNMHSMHMDNEVRLDVGSYL